jgi:hypothetical protein
MFLPDDDHDDLGGREPDETSVGWNLRLQPTKVEIIPLAVFS